MKYWPEYTTPNEKSYALRHVQILERTLSFCNNFRTAIQAGGNIGYWPARLAIDFEQVLTFEPEPMMYDCLKKNLVACKNVKPRNQALGAQNGTCDIERISFGSHRVKSGSSIEMITIDSLELVDLDFLQLDIEGYEINALQGSIITIQACRPLIQVEILDDRNEMFTFMKSIGYRFIDNFGRDFLFE